MDVDEDSSEVGLKSSAVFSKSKEMTVTFYAQLPLEVRQALRNAGASSLIICNDYPDAPCRLLQGGLYWGRGPSYWFRSGCVPGHMFRLEIQSSTLQTTHHILT